MPSRLHRASKGEHSSWRSKDHTDPTTLLTPTLPGPNMGQMTPKPSGTLTEGNGVCEHKRRRNGEWGITGPEISTGGWGRLIAGEQWAGRQGTATIINTRQVKYHRIP